MVRDHGLAPARTTHDDVRTPLTDLATVVSFGNPKHLSTCISV